MTNGAEFHQALHGYSDGHRELALSVKLNARDRRIMLALSDMSSAGARLDDDGYLTGYPLPESKLYALARTWPAPEMPRPGCVWTHTLLIDFADLAVISSLSDIDLLFRRPAGASDITAYQRPRSLPSELGPKRQLSFYPWAHKVVAALYDRPKNSIVSMNPGCDVDEVVLELWSQQWPRLRRSFRFCTMTTGDRSLEGALFDLQVVPATDRHSRGRFKSAVDAESFAGAYSPWIEDTLRDLSDPDIHGLRTFLMRYGSELTGGREAFKALCELHVLLRSSAEDPGRVVRATIDMLHRESSLFGARSIQDAVLENGLRYSDAVDEASFRFLWKHLSDVEPSKLDKYVGRVGQAAWNWDPGLLENIPEVGLRGEIVNRTLSTLEAATLIEGLKSVPALAPRAIVARPEILEETAFWTQAELTGDALRFLTSDQQILAALSAMLRCKRDDLPEYAVANLGVLKVLEAINQPPIVTEELSPWTTAVAREPGEVAKFLANARHISRRLIVELSKVLRPEAVPNSYGRDAWIIAWENSVGELEEQDDVFLAAYFLTRALGPTSRSAPDLAVISFDRFYHAVATDSASPAAWRLVEPELPRKPSWSDWDRCKRLRAAILDLFISGENMLEPFAHLTKSDSLFETLTKEAVRSVRGRYFLRKLVREIKGSEDAVLYRRLSYLEKLLD